MNTNQFFYVYDIYNKMVKLEDLTTTQIKAMINKYNKKVTITGISKLKKAELIDKIRKHPRIEVQEGDTVKLKLVKDKRTLAQKVKEEREKRKAKPQAKQSQEKQPEPKKPFASLEKKRETVKEIKKKKAEPPKKPPLPPYAKFLKKKDGKLVSKTEIKVTEEEKPKRKVMRVGGRFITPKKKEIKSDLPPIPKSKARIRVAPKEKKEEPKREETDDVKDLKKLIKSDTEHLQSLKSMKSKPSVDKAIKATEKILKSYKKELSELQGKKEEKPQPKAKPKPQPEPEPEDSDNESVEPPIKKIPKKLHSIWREYMEYKVGDWYSPNDQNEELEQLKEDEKGYFKAQKSLQNKSGSVKQRSKSIQAKASFTDAMRNEFEENEGFKKIYKLIAPKLLKEFEEQKE